MAILEPLLRPDFWSLTVLDKAGRDDPQNAAFVCRKVTHPCAVSDWPLIDPSALQRSGALEGE